MLGLNLYALLETLLFLCALTFYSIFFGNNDRFLSVSPHPFWFILLVIIIQYDGPEIIFCLVMMVIFLYAGNLPEQTIWETELDYSTKLAYLPLSWFIMAVFLDSIKTRRIKSLEPLNNKIIELEKTNKLLADNFEQVEAKNIHMESKLASESNSFIKANDAIRMLAELNMQNFKDIMISVVSTTLNPNKFSIYLTKPTGLELIACHGIKNEDIHRRFISNEDEFYSAVIASKKVITIADKQEEILLSGQGVIAGPIFDKASGEVCGMLKFEEYEFEGLISKNIEIFKIICRWLGSAYVRAVKTERAKKNMFINENNELHSYYYFNKQKEFLISMARRMKFPLSSITIDVLNKETLEKEEMDELSNTMMNIILSHFRVTDEVFGSSETELGFIILLPGTSKEQSKIVLDKLKERISLMNNSLITKARFSFEINYIVEEST